MTAENYSKVIEKIKKLFALGKSSNEHEAALAMERAREMMMKYNIEQAELAKDQVEDIIEIDFTLNSKFNTPATTLAYWLAECFMVKAIIIKTQTGYHKTDKKIKFIGSISDIATATYIYSYILNLVDIKSKEYFETVRYTKEKWSPLGAKKVKNDYSYGFVTAICTKLKRMKEDREAANPYEAEAINALVVVKDANINKYIEDHIGKTKKTKGKVKYNAHHFGAGESEGEKTGIHRGVGGKNKNDQLSIGR